MILAESFFFISCLISLFCFLSKAGRLGVSHWGNYLLLLDTYFLRFPKYYPLLVFDVALR